MKFLGAPSSGSMAGTTFSHNRAGQYQRNRRAPVQPVGTGRRGIVKANFGAASSGWSGLTAAQQAAWVSFANGHPITDALGQSITLTGHQMYVSCSAQLLNCGTATLPNPPSTSVVFVATAPVFTAVHSGAITLTPAGGGGATDFQLIAFSAPVSAGVLFQKTFWQESHVAGNSVAAIVATTAYNAQFGTPVAGQRIFYRVTPVNQYGFAGTPVIGFATVS